MTFLPTESRAQYQLRRTLRVVHELVLRLKQGLPPNETGVWPNATAAGLADIWNSAWAYNCLRLEEDPKWGTPSNLSDLFRLILKAIEVSYVQTKFGPELKSIAAHEHTEQGKD